MILVYYLDTSALAKIYIDESGTGWMQQLLVQALPQQLYLSHLARVEMASAIARRQQTGSLSPANARKSLQQFSADWFHRYTVVAVSSEIIERAYGLTIQHGLRAYDAVHLASALTVRSAFASLEGYALVFVSADQRLLQCAQQEGLRVENPLNYA
ncbi:MAG: VapC toxin family PIN domain ribonuclease [Armatimonadetes bacterium JP3_11]|jgi:predicted nucleic acid-binding protein|nr:MAG: VapC toxin family PIN domain ribonuclease [Armatimonadetes bacterium CP1_7O]OYT75101.1 MAG: VapC toxin family PIN domain ribonuclease [Armatimonadetes bacterium JP3_11]RMH09702.1 MAG: PIN domain-containing protein [Armatimonadota bacterium]